MQFATALLALGPLLAAGASASTLPLASRDTYDRKGSAMCGAMQVKYCDEAVNDFLVRDDAYRYRPDVYNRCAGACSGAGAAGSTVAAGCHVSVEGDPECRRSGNQLWGDYQDLRAHGASKCGSKHWDQWRADGSKLACRTTVNYISDCLKGKDETCQAD